MVHLLAYEILIGYRFDVRHAYIKHIIFGTLNVRVPIILSHLREGVQDNVRYIWSFRRPAVLAIDKSHSLELTA